MDKASQSQPRPTSVPSPGSSAEPSGAARDADLLRDAWGALNFILAFYEPGQRYLDTEAWKQAEAGGKRAHDALSERLGNSRGWWAKDGTARSPQPIREDQP